MFTPRFSIKNLLILAFCIKIVLLVLVSFLFYRFPSTSLQDKVHENRFLSSFYMYDGVNYLSICKNSYRSTSDDEVLKVQFYSFLPGMPLLNCMATAYAGFILPDVNPNINDFGPVIVSLISYVALLLTIKFYLDEFYPEDTDHKKYFMLLTYILSPYGFFFNLNYTETIFVPLLFLSFTLLKLREYKRLSVTGFIIGYFRITALPLGFLLGLKTLWQEYQFNRKENIKPLKSLLLSFKYALYSITFAIGSLSFFAFLQYKYGSYRLFFDSQSSFYNRNQGFFQGLINYAKSGLNYWDTLQWTNDINITGFDFYTSDFRYFATFSLPALIVILGSILLIYNKKWFELSFAWILLLIPLYSSELSFNRYILQSFPFLFAISESAYKFSFTRHALFSLYSSLFLLFFTLHIFGFWIG